MSPSPVMPLVAILDEEGQMTGITCPLNVGVDPHDIEGCEDLLESYFMQVGGCRHCPCPEHLYLWHQHPLVYSHA